MFIAALFTIATTWKQPKCPLTDEWIKNIILSEVRQGKTNILWYHLYVESKNKYKRIYIQNRNRFTNTENKLMVTEGERWGEG